jgi:DNA polymerase elongation subunit (family B)
MYITQSVDKLMNGEVQINDLVISKLLRQNIEKYKSLFPHVSAAIRLNVSEPLRIVEILSNMFIQTRVTPIHCRE